MKIITRYVITETLSYFLVSLFAFTALLLVARILRFTNLIVNKGVEPGQIGMVFLTVIPTFLEIALPMAALLGVMMALGRLSADSEIVVMRASGISLSQLIKPVLIFAALCTALCFYISLELRPWGHRQLSQTLFEIARTKSTAGLEEGMFNKIGQIVLYADSVNHETGEVAHILIDDKRDKTRRQITLAKHGTIISDDVNHTIVISLFDGVVHEDYKGQHGATKFFENKLTLSSDEIYNPDAHKKTGKLFREKGSVDLEAYIAELTEVLSKSDPKSKDPIGDYAMDYRGLNKELIQSKIERGRRISMPFAAFLLSLIAMPLGIQPPRMQRTWGVSLSIALAMFVFVLYYAFMSIGVALAESGKLHPLIGLWVPNIVVALLTGYFLYKMGTEQWQSISQGVEQFILKIVNRFRKRRSE